MKTKLAILMAPFLALANFSYADVSYGGDGCPAGTAEVALGANGEVTLYLANYDLQSNSAIKRRSCNIAIPITVPSGYSANFGNVQLVGSYDTKKGTTAVLSTEAFFAGGSGVQNNSNFSAGTSGNINLSFTPHINWSPCGASVNLRLNTSILLNGNADNSQIKITQISIGKPLLRRC